MIVAHLDTGREWRGGQAQVLLLMRGLRSRGHPSFLLAPRGPLLDRARGAGFETFAWRPLLEWDPAAGWAAARRLGRSRPDIVHCHSARAHAVGVPAARLAGLPVVVSRRSAGGIADHPLSRLKYRRGADRYLCVSRPVMRAMAACGVPAERLALVPSGIEPAPRPGGPDLRAEIGAPRDAPIVGTVAALTREKNHSLLLAAASRVAERFPDVRFTWIGEGPSRPDLERDRARLGLEGRVHLLGFRTDARALAAQFTVFALASSREGLGTSLLDAQAAGIPVVATAVGGVPEVVRDGVTGRLVPDGDAAALAGALIEALADPARRAAWGGAARIAAEAFGADSMVERTIAVYRLVLGGRGGPRLTGSRGRVSVREDILA